MCSFDHLCHKSPFLWNLIQGDRLCLEHVYAPRYVFIQGYMHVCMYICKFQVHRYRLSLFGATPDHHCILGNFIYSSWAFCCNYFYFFNLWNLSNWKAFLLLHAFHKALEDNEYCLSLLSLNGCDHLGDSRMQPGSPRTPDASGACTWEWALELPHGIRWKPGRES